MELSEQIATWESQPHPDGLVLIQFASWTWLKGKVAQLEAENERLRELCNDVALGHQNPYDSNYNECDKEPCAWCEEFQALGGNDE